MYRLLIVDDEQGVRSGIARYFPWATLDILIAGVCEDGAEALQFLATHDVDLVLCDIRMPKVDGLQFARVVRERGWHSEIVFISAYEDFEYARQAIELGIKHYIVKPAGYEELRDVFRKLVKGLRTDSVEESTRADRSENWHSPDKSSSLFDRVGLLVEHSLASVTLVSAAQQLGMSPNHFSFRFHSETGTTFAQFVRETRMRRAKEMLLTRSLRIYEVSRRVGYSSVKSFARAFKHYYGESPRDLQARNR